MILNCNFAFGQLNKMLSDEQMIPCDDHTMFVRTVEERS